MEPRGRDLHSAVEDEERVRRFPLLAPDYVKRRRRDEILHFAVVTSRKEEGGVVFHLEPEGLGYMRLHNGVPRKQTALRHDLARRQGPAD